MDSTYRYTCPRKRCKPVETAMSPSGFRAATGRFMSCNHGPMRLDPQSSALTANRPVVVKEVL